MKSAPSAIVKRIAIFLSAAIISLYLIGVSGLWAYYHYFRDIKEVQYLDILWFPRFYKANQAVGTKHLHSAEENWKAGNYAQGIYFARAAVTKYPQNPEARLFLAQCFQAVRRTSLACNILDEGLKYDTAEMPLAKTLVQYYIQSNRYTDILNLIHKRLPDLNQKISDSDQTFFRKAELHATFESAGTAAATNLHNRWPELDSIPDAIPLIARIDMAQSGPDAALSRLQQAVDKYPDSPVLHDAYISTALKAKRNKEAGIASEVYVQKFPNSASAHLRFLESHGSRINEDRQPWLVGIMRYLAQFYRDQSTLEELANLAARQGWDDLAFVLYENSIAYGMRERNFAICYLGSLLTTRQYAKADLLWNEVQALKAGTSETLPLLAAMVAEGNGRASDAQERITAMRAATKAEPLARTRLAALLSDFGFPSLAEALLAKDNQPTPSGSPTSPAS
jgi:predicted Zn-dependent protease